VMSRAPRRIRPATAGVRGKSVPQGIVDLTLQTLCA
jgi:hypothetical protein